MRDYIFFNNKMLSDFHTFITDAGVYQSPKRLYDAVSIPGRNGDVLFEQNRFDNIEHSYPVIILDDFDKNFDGLKAFLLGCEGYLKLADTFHPDEFYMATFSRIEKINITRDHEQGACVIVFDRKPQKFLVEGTKVQKYTTFPATIYNPTQFKAYPLIRLYGSGTLAIGDITLSLATMSEYVDIDCELQEALQMGENINITLNNGEFPYFTKGANNIAWTGSKVEITPRWYSI